ncbi:hypothetical protein MMC25_000250 [Agyrium rufum]|nr:hypothetical protein [Agyrium rufum]
MAEAVAAYYAVETGIEAALAAGLVIAQPTLPISARFKKIKTSQPLPRSSHSLSVIEGRAFVFGGEIKARQPVENDVHIYTFPLSGVDEADYEAVKVQPSSPDGEVPSARVGHTSVTGGSRIYVFGGRGGPDLQPIEEKGRVWVFDTKVSKWSFLDPTEGSPIPEARSYHAAAISPESMNMGTTPYESLDDAFGIMFVHGGCPASGRLSDVWAFDIRSRIWQRLQDAPGPTRGGAGLAFAQNRLWRFGGFDGKNQIGGELDCLTVGALSSAPSSAGIAKSSAEPDPLTWTTFRFNEGVQSPGARSVAGLHPVTTGAGRNYLILTFGERDSSEKGHEGAGKFWDDIWAFQIPADEVSGAGAKDETRKMIGAKTGVLTWAPVDVPEFSKTKGALELPEARGWFASAIDKETSAKGLVIWGGLNEENERLGDGWILEFVA